MEKRVRAGCVGSAGAGAELRGSASAAPPCRGGYRCAPASSTGEPGARTRGHTGWTLLYWLHKIKDPTVDYSKLTDYSMLTGWPSSKGRSRTSRSCRWSARWCCLILHNGLAHVRSRARATQTLPDAAAPRSHFLRGYSAVCPCPCARGRGQHNGKVRSIDTVKSRMLADRTPTWTLLVCFPLRGGRVGGDLAALLASACRHAWRHWCYKLCPIWRTAPRKAPSSLHAKPIGATKRLRSFAYAT